ncbi:cation diffusion facilitator family transporter [Telmatospirillum sp.]|uniref:cation diffusion facilitator family transporter n=1 Tax=Telmatospirillum sp. TaxID=2079197 RepID=UPI0028446D42|nr:cation diffusion facilitator family transporter [Telmatospirillum sp.]MDR3438442.1 cation diffusion facilitator family transporter [Telmatospirillum sp.]
MTNDAVSKKSVALSSVWASALLTATKLIAGLLTGSLGLLSEAAHSLLDLGAAGLTYFAVRISDQPADERHPYGHGKIESVSALAETVLLFLTALWIIREAVLRLLSDNVAVEARWYSVAVVLLSIAVDFGRSRALMKVAKATRSQALEADALHFSSDILSSIVVLAGLGCVAAGFPKGDAIAAIGVSLFVLHVGYQMGKRTIDVLIDSAPEGIASQVAEIASQVAGVASIDRVRARPAGATTHVEVLIRVARTLPLANVQEVCDAVTVAIDGRIPGSDAFVKAEPLALDDESIIDTVHVVAARRNVLLHDIAVDTVAGRRHVSFDVEVDETMNIFDAHEVASGVEQAVRDELGEDVLVETHIDPRRVSVLAGRTVDAVMHRQLETVVINCAQGVDHVREAHGVHIRQGEDGLTVLLHCLFEPTTSVRTAHHATEVVEQRIRESIKDVGRVVVHAEPLDSVDVPIKAG